MVKPAASSCPPELSSGGDRAGREALGEKVVVISYDSEHPEKAAKHFFAELRAADKHGADAILAAAIEEKGVGFSVMNRMLKSAGYNIAFRPSYLLRTL